MRLAKLAKTTRTLPTGRRVPMTVLLTRENQDFVDSCVDLKEFNSVDQVFDAALSLYRRHVLALKRYAEEQTHKGYTRSEILASIQCETVVTKALRRRSTRPR